MLAQAGPVAGHARRPGIERGPGDAGDAHPVLQNAPQDGERGGRWSALLLALQREVSLLLVVFMLIVFVLDRNTQIAPPGAACEPSTATTTGLPLEPAEGVLRQLEPAPSRLLLVLRGGGGPLRPLLQLVPTRWRR